MTDPVVIRSNMISEVEYEYQSGTYLVTRTFNLENANAEAGAASIYAGEMNMPPLLDHMPKRAEGELVEVPTQLVHFKIVQRSPNFCAVVTLYEGHVFGTLRFEHSVGSRSDLLIRDLDPIVGGDYAGKHMMIGPNAEGTQRLVPISTWRVWQTCPKDEIAEGPPCIAAMRNYVQALECSVCEAGWQTPWYETGAAEAPMLAAEGQYLYLGAEEIVHRDDSLTFVHTFIEDTERYRLAAGAVDEDKINQKYFYWYPMTTGKFPLINGTYCVLGATPITPRIYPVANTDATKITPSYDDNEEAHYRLYWGRTIGFADFGFTTTTDR